MMYLAADNTYIGKVRVISSRDARHDTLAIQLRLRTLLNAAPLQPAGLPSSTIICIRNFPDPLPGAVCVYDSRPTPRWEQAIALVLKRLIIVVTVRRFRY